MVTQRGEQALSAIWGILGGRRDAAARIWDDEMSARDQFVLLLEATNNRQTAREQAGRAWEGLPKLLCPKLRLALEKRAARAEAFAAALAQVSQ